jgi:hypothetical protein
MLARHDCNSICCVKLSTSGYFAGERVKPQLAVR